VVKSIFISAIDSARLVWKISEGPAASVSLAGA
jgi:hypothetical protein